MEDKDIFETQWEQELPPENEMKQIQRTIRKRNGRIIAISVVLAAVILLGSVYGIVPLIESFYWHPGTETAAANASDLTLTMHAYTELFCPGWNVTRINWQEADGLAAYDLQFNILDLGKREYFRLDGKLEKGKVMEAVGYLRGKGFTGTVGACSKRDSGVSVRVLGVSGNDMEDKGHGR